MFAINGENKIETSIRLFQDEILSRMTEVDSGIEGVTEYFVPAFPEEAQKMSEQFQADLADAVGIRSLGLPRWPGAGGVYIGSSRASRRGTAGSAGGRGIEKIDYQSRPPRPAARPLGGGARRFHVDWIRNAIKCAHDRPPTGPTRSATPPCAGFPALRDFLTVQKILDTCSRHLFC